MQYWEQSDFLFKGFLLPPLLLSFSFSRYHISLSYPLTPPLWGSPSLTPLSTPPISSSTISLLPPTQRYYLIPVKRLCVPHRGGGGTIWIRAQTHSIIICFFARLSFRGEVGIPAAFFQMSIQLGRLDFGRDFVVRGEFAISAGALSSQTSWT